MCSMGGDHRNVCDAEVRIVEKETLPISAAQPEHVVPPKATFKSSMFERVFLVKTAIVTATVVPNPAGHRPHGRAGPPDVRAYR
jgi:hypothetical protein